MPQRRKLFSLGRKKVQRGHADSRLLVLLSLVDDLASGQRYFRASVLRSNTGVVLDIVLETIERNVILHTESGLWSKLLFFIKNRV